MENSRNKKVISFKFLTILSSVMKSEAIPPDVNHPFVQCTLPISLLVATWVIRSTVTLIAVLVFK